MKSQNKKQQLCCSKGIREDCECYIQGRADMKKEILNIISCTKAFIIKRDLSEARNRKAIDFKKEIIQAIQKLNVTPKIYKSSQSPSNISNRNVLQFKQADTIVKDKGEKNDNNT